jgi:cytidine deaminase
MKSQEERLIEAAKSIQGEFRLRGDFTAGTVAAAILTSKGNIFTGICIDLACGLGFCAEVAAIAEMLKHREKQIIAVVAVGDTGDLLAPCGRCRETIAQLDERNMDCRVLLSGGRSVPLGTLLQEHWLDTPQKSS